MARNFFTKCSFHGDRCRRDCPPGSAGRCPHTLKTIQRPQNRHSSKPYLRKTRSWLQSGHLKAVCAAWLPFNEPIRRPPLDTQPSLAPTPFLARADRLNEMPCESSILSTSPPASEDPRERATRRRPAAPVPPR